MDDKELLKLVDKHYSPNKEGLYFKEWRIAAGYNRAEVWSTERLRANFPGAKPTPLGITLLLAWDRGEDPTEWRAAKQQPVKPAQPKVDPYQQNQQRRDANGNLIDRLPEVLYRPGWTSPAERSSARIQPVASGFDDPTGDDILSDS